MKVHLGSVSGALYLVFTWGQGIWHSDMSGSPSCSGVGWRASKGLLTEGDPPLKSVFQGWVLSCGFLYGHGTKQGSLLIGRPPGECELQHFHQQLWFHCWDNYGEWVKTQAALLCWGYLSPWNTYPLHWSSPRRWGIWCVFRSPVVYQETWTFLLSYLFCFVFVFCGVFF